MSQSPDHVSRIQDQWRAARPDLDPTPQGVIGRLHRLARALTDQLTTVFAAHGLSEGEFDVLCALRRAEPGSLLRPADIARTTMVTTGGLTKRLDSLEAAGLITRAAAEAGDARTKVVSLTDGGRTLIDRAFSEHLANEHRLLAMVPAADRPELERILRGWLAEFEPAITD